MEGSTEKMGGMSLGEDEDELRARGSRKKSVVQDAEY
jgi:hypothetical protein